MIGPKDSVELVERIGEPWTVVFGQVVDDVDVQPSDRGALENSGRPADHDEPNAMTQQYA